MSDFDEKWITIAEFARLAGMQPSSLYQYRSRGLYNVPKPAKVLGTIKFFRRTDALAWIAAREERKRDYDFG